MLKLNSHEVHMTISVTTLIVQYMCWPLLTGPIRFETKIDSVCPFWAKQGKVSQTHMVFPPRMSATLAVCL